MRNSVVLSHKLVIDDEDIRSDSGDIASIASMWSYIDHILTTDLVLEGNGRSSYRVKVPRNFVSSFDQLSAWTSGIQVLRDRMLNVLWEDVDEVTLMELGHDLSNAFMPLKADIFDPLLQPDTSPAVFLQVRDKH
jgi:hypothetical protein